MDIKPVDDLIKSATEEGVFPGAAYAFGTVDKHVSNAQGRHTYCPESKKTELNSLWDLASVSKVVGTTSAGIILHGQGKLDLEQPVAELVPEFAQNGKEKVTIRNLIVHDSGLPPFKPYHRSFTDPSKVVEAVYAEPLQYATGTKTIYSDLNMIVFAQILEQISGRKLDAYLNEQVWVPLGMATTLYNPVPQLRQTCTPTEAVEPWRLKLRKLRGQNSDGIVALEKQPDGSTWIQGEVHDPTCMTLGGVAGHAGLFSTCPDLVKYMQALLRNGAPVFKPETLKTWTRRQSDASSRALGWDTNWQHKASAGANFSEVSFGHTGYTGTSVWCDPEAGVFAILLTNRVHPTAENTKIIQFRPRFHQAVREALKTA